MEHGYSRDQPTLLEQPYKRINAQEDVIGLAWKPKG
jgi:hypothetical protein